MGNAINWQHSSVFSAKLLYFYCTLIENQQDLCGALNEPKPELDFFGWDRHHPHHHLDVVKRLHLETTHQLHQRGLELIFGQLAPDARPKNQFSKIPNRMRVGAHLAPMANGSDAERRARPSAQRSGSNRCGSGKLAGSRPEVKIDKISTVPAGMSKPLIRMSSDRILVRKGATG